MMRLLAVGTVGNLSMLLLVFMKYDSSPAMREVMDKIDILSGSPSVNLCVICGIMYFMLSFASIFMGYCVIVTLRDSARSDTDEGDGLLRKDVTAIREDVCDLYSRDMYFSMMDKGIRPEHSFCADVLKKRFIRIFATQHRLSNQYVTEMTDTRIADLSLPSHLKDRLASLSYDTLYDLGMICTDRPSSSELTEEEMSMIDRCLKESDVEIRCGSVYTSLLNCPK